MNNNKQNGTSRKWYYAIVGAIGVLLIGMAVLIVLDKQKAVEEAPPLEVKHEPTEIERPIVDEQKENTSTDNGYIEGQTLPAEPTYIDGILIASKRYPLPATFAPGESSTAKKAMNELIAAGRVAGYELTAFSGYRTFEYQQGLYDNYVARDGKDKADTYSARPGYSEHQTGLTYDVGEVGNESVWLTEAFGETPAGQWLRDNAHTYGFILRYPKGKEPITGYMYESWHFRYVGVEIATHIFTNDSTLEEYLKIE